MQYIYYLISPDPFFGLLATHLTAGPGVNASKKLYYSRFLYRVLPIFSHTKTTFPLVFVSFSRWLTMFLNIFILNHIYSYHLLIRSTYCEGLKGFNSSLHLLGIILSNPTLRLMSKSENLTTIKKYYYETCKVYYSML